MWSVVLLIARAAPAATFLGSLISFLRGTAAGRAVAAARFQRHAPLRSSPCRGVGRPLLAAAVRRVGRRVVAFALVGAGLCLPPELTRAASIAHAFEPAQPSTTDFIRLRTDSQGCFSQHGVAVVKPDEPAIEVYFEGSDVGCDPGNPQNLQSPRYADVGLLPAGVYATRVLSCAFGPLETVCHVTQTGSLVVADRTGSKVRVPGTSLTSLTALGLLVMILVGLRLRGR